MRVITQNLSQIAADPDGFATNQNIAASGGFMSIDGVLAGTIRPDGRQTVDLRNNGGVGSVMRFTTGATGSVAVATVIGKTLEGVHIEEQVTMPGAAASVDTTSVFGFIESIELDGAATNLSTGVPGGVPQFSPWTPMDHNQSQYNVNVVVSLVSGVVDYTLEHALDNDMIRVGSPPEGTYDEGAPFAGATASAQGMLADPVTATRIRINSGTAAVLKAQFKQSGGGYR